MEDAFKAECLWSVLYDGAEVGPRVMIEYIMKVIDVDSPLQAILNVYSVLPSDSPSIYTPNQLFQSFGFFQ